MRHVLAPCSGCHIWHCAVCGCLPWPRPVPVEGDPLAVEVGPVLFEGGPVAVAVGS